MRSRRRKLDPYLPVRAAASAQVSARLLRGAFGTHSSVGSPLHAIVHPSLAGAPSRPNVDPQSIPVQPDAASRGNLGTHSICKVSNKKHASGRRDILGAKFRACETESEGKTRILSRHTKPLV